METIMIVLVTLIFGMIFFNVINNKRFSIISFLLLLLLGGYYLIKAKYNDYYLEYTKNIKNIEYYVLIYGIINLVIAIIQYVLSIRKNSIKSNNNQDVNKINDNKDVIIDYKKQINLLLVYLEMIDEPLACLVNDEFVINNKMKKLLKYDNYLIDKKKFNDYINNADKNSFFESKKSVPFRIKVDHQYIWFETNFTQIDNIDYCLIRKSININRENHNLQSFKQLNSLLENYEKDYYLIFFNIINYNDILSFYGKDYTKLVINKHLDDIYQSPYFSNLNLYYISQCEYVILLDNLVEYNILLSELENNSSILIKNDISLLDNKTCLRGKIGVIASVNVKDKNKTNVINKGLEMLRLACDDDYNGEYAIFHEVDENIDYSLRDFGIDLNLDISKFRRRLQ